MMGRGYRDMEEDNKEVLLKILIITVSIIVDVFITYFIDFNGLFRCEGDISIIRDTIFCIKRL